MRRWDVVTLSLLGFTLFIVYRFVLILFLSICHHELEHILSFETLIGEIYPNVFTNGFISTLV